MARVCDLVRVGTPADLDHPSVGRVLWRPIGNGVWALTHAEPPTADFEDVLIAGDEELLSDEWALAPGAASRHGYDAETRRLGRRIMALLTVGFGAAVFLGYALGRIAAGS